MKNLNEFIRRENAVAELFKTGKTLSTNQLSETDAKSIFYKLDSEMSPEHLHMDGEISAEQAQQRAKFFTAVYNELVGMGFVPPNDLWCIGRN